VHCANITQIFKSSVSIFHLTYGDFSEIFETVIIKLYFTRSADKQLFCSFLEILVQSCFRFQLEVGSKQHPIFVENSNVFCKKKMANENVYGSPNCHLPLILSSFHIISTENKIEMRLRDIISFLLWSFLSACTLIIL